MFTSSNVFCFCNLKYSRINMIIFARHFHHILKTSSVSALTRIGTASFNIQPFLQNDNVLKFLKLLQENNLDLVGKNNYLGELVHIKKGYENELTTLTNMKESNKEMLELIEDEKRNYNSKIQNINETILMQFVPDKNVEHRDVIIEVNAGVGGKEAMLFAHDLFDMYCRYFTYKRWAWELQDFDLSELGGIRNGSAFVSGINASFSLEQESGVHRVQRVPATEKSGRIHTSTVSVAILPQPTELEINIKEKDLKIDTKTSSGAGGQHVNKTESCVRITHLPTGIVIENQTDRSQIKNKKLALQRLRSKLYQMELEGINSKTRSSRKEQVGSSMRSEKIRTYNFNQDRITDHRLGISLHDLPQFFEGNSALDNLISQLIEHSIKQQLMRFIDDQLSLINVNSR